MPTLNAGSHMATLKPPETLGRLLEATFRTARVHHYTEPLGLRQPSVGNKGATKRGRPRYEGIASDLNKATREIVDQIVDTYLSVGDLCETICSQPTFLDASIEPLLKEHGPLLWNHNSSFKTCANDIDELNQDYVRPDYLLYEDNQDRVESVL